MITYRLLTGGTPPDDYETDEEFDTEEEARAVIAELSPYEPFALHRLHSTVTSGLYRVDRLITFQDKEG
jgi:hypothetical protein